LDIVFRCHDCEREITLPERPANGKIMCPSCRTVLNVPEPGSAAEETGGTYTTAQVKRCPQCNKETTSAAVICIGCGYNFQSGKQTRKVVRVKALERSWWYGPIPLFHKIIQLQKTRTGEALVTVTDHIFCIPIGTTEIDLRQCQEIWTDYRQGFGVVGWTITLILFLLCVCPGLWWLVWAFNKPTYILRLPRHKLSEITLYEGMNGDTMRDLLDSIAEMGQLKIVRK
jgi:ribosomal protein S27E